MEKSQSQKLTFEINLLLVQTLCDENDADRGDACDVDNNIGDDGDVNDNVGEDGDGVAAEVQFLAAPIRSSREAQCKSNSALETQAEQSKVRVAQCLLYKESRDGLEKKSQAKRSKAEQGSFTLLQRHSGEKQKGANSKGEQHSGTIL